MISQLTQEKPSPMPMWSHSTSDVFCSNIKVWGGSAETVAWINERWGGLPDFWNPFPPRFNPNHSTASLNARNWICTIGLVQGESATKRMDKSRFSELAARVYPEAGCEELEAAVFWLSWLFFADDQLDECHLGRSLEEGKKVIQGILSLADPLSAREDGPQNPVEAAFLSFWERVAPKMSARQRARYLRHVRAYMIALIWEVENRASDRVPDLFSYNEARRATGALGTVFDLIEYTTRAELPATVCESEPMRVLRDTAMDVVCMTNDILSYKKEVARGETNNYVVICSHLLNGNVADAMVLVNEMQSSRIRLFLLAKQELSAYCDGLGLDSKQRRATELYVEGMEHWMRGNLDFTLYSPRYFEVETTRPNAPVSWIENLTDMSTSALTAPSAIAIQI